MDWDRARRTATEWEELWEGWNGEARTAAPHGFMSELYKGKKIRAVSTGLLRRLKGLEVLCPR